MMAFRRPRAEADRPVGNKNAKGEYYLTDIVEIASAARPRCRCDRSQFRECARRQRPRRAGAGRRHLADAPPARGHAGGRDADRAGNRVFLPRHRDRPRYDRRAQCLVRSRREDRRRRQDPRLQPYRRRHHCVQLRCRAVRAVAAGRRPQEQGQGRQFRRGQEGCHRGRRQGQPSDLYRRCPRRRGRQYRRRHHHLQL